VGGFVGYFGFEMGKYAESIPIYPYTYHRTPQGWWMFYDQILIFDQVKKQAYLSQLILDENQVREEIERQLDNQIEEVTKGSLRELEEIHLSHRPACVSFEQLETAASYVKKIETIKEHIFRGDIYQACLTHPFFVRKEHDPYQLYKILRRINPAPFSCFLKMNHLSILSTSPERFLHLDLEGRLESRPIKGTRPRGEASSSDLSLKQELQESEKDRAENVMIVDLVRNDLGRICSSVWVPKLLQVESYATVHQLVSSVEGQMKSPFQPMDAIRASFPGGSMTGAPKIRALEIIHSLESIGRGVYSGGLGYLDVRGCFDLSMVIRTILSSGSFLSFHVGGGIVADSDPKEEYQETLDKAFALKKAISLLRETP
jgi:aminodeoxychorismate synthase component I